MNANPRRTKVAAYLFLNAEKNHQKVVFRIRNSSEKHAESTSDRYF
jgi:hypothetical protein